MAFPGEDKSQYGLPLIPSDETIQGLQRSADFDLVWKQLISESALSPADHAVFNAGFETYSVLSRAVGKNLADTLSQCVFDAVDTMPSPQAAPVRLCANTEEELAIQIVSAKTLQSAVEGLDLTLRKRYELNDQIKRLCSVTVRCEKIRMGLYQSDAPVIAGIFRLHSKWHEPLSIPGYQHAQDTWDTIQSLPEAASTAYRNKFTAFTSIVMRYGTATARVFDNAWVKLVLSRQNILPAHIPDSTKVSWLSGEITPLLRYRDDEPESVRPEITDPTPFDTFQHDLVVIKQFIKGGSISVSHLVSYTQSDAELFQVIGTDAWEHEAHKSQKRK